MNPRNMKIRSSVVIAKLLASEGYSEFLANRIVNYNKNRIMTERQWRDFQRRKEDVSRICRQLNPADRLLIGKFISMHHRMGLETGLRIGLTSFAVLNDKAKEVPEDEFDFSGMSLMDLEPHELIEIIANLRMQNARLNRELEELEDDD